MEARGKGTASQVSNIKQREAEDGEGQVDNFPLFSPLRGSSLEPFRKSPGCQASLFPEGSAVFCHGPLRRGSQARNPSPEMLFVISVNLYFPIKYQILDN